MCLWNGFISAVRNRNRKSTVRALSFQCFPYIHLVASSWRRMCEDQSAATTNKIQIGQTLYSLCAHVRICASGIPLEWKEMRQSHRGHLSTGSLRMTSSGKMTTVMYSNLHSLSRIWVIGLDLDFFIMQQIPTMICRSGGWRREHCKCKQCPDLRWNSALIHTSFSSSVTYFRFAVFSTYLLVSLGYMELSFLSVPNVCSSAPHDAY